MSESGNFGGGEAGGPVQPCPLRTPPAHWIAIEMVGADDRPIAGAAYRVTLADGATRVEGKLDVRGKARVEGLVDAGACKVSFPELDQDAWEDA